MAEALAVAVLSFFKIQIAQDYFHNYHKQNSTTQKKNKGRKGLKYILNKQ